MPNLPEPWGGDRPSRNLSRATRAQEETELAIHKHALGARYQAECDRIDTEAISDVVSAAMDEELKVLSHGLEQAAGSVAKAELVARLSSLHSRIDNARIARRFGG